MPSFDSFGGGGPLAVALASALLGLTTVLLALRAYTSFRLVERMTWDFLWVSIAYVPLSSLSSCRSIISAYQNRGDTVAGYHCPRLPRALHSLRHWKPLDRGRSHTSCDRLPVRLDLQHLHHRVERVWETCYPRHLAPHSRENPQNQALDPLFRGCIDHASERQSKHHCVVPVQAEG